MQRRSASLLSVAQAAQNHHHRRHLPHQQHYHIRHHRHLHHHHHHHHRHQKRYHHHHHHHHHHRHHVVVFGITTTITASIRFVLKMLVSLLMLGFSGLSLNIWSTFAILPITHYIAVIQPASSSSYSSRSRESSSSGCSRPIQDYHQEHRLDDRHGHHPFSIVVSLSPLSRLSSKAKSRNIDRLHRSSSSIIIIIIIITVPSAVANETAAPASAGGLSLPNSSRVQCSTEFRGSRKPQQG